MIKGIRKGPIVSDDTAPIIFTTNPVLILNSKISQSYFDSWAKELPGFETEMNDLYQKIQKASDDTVKDKLFMYSNDRTKQKLYALWLADIGDISHELRMAILLQSCETIKKDNPGKQIAVRTANFQLGKSIQKKDDFYEYFANDYGTYNLYK